MLCSHMVVSLLPTPLVFNLKNQGEKEKKEMHFNVNSRETRKEVNC